MIEKKTGEYLKELRLKTGHTLRSFCLTNGIDAGNWSKMERGLLNLPHGDKLEKYAKALGLTEGSNEWYELFDLASISAGQIPSAVMSNEQVVSKLPILFRTLRGQQVDSDKLDELIELVRRS
ncbi:MAG: transcriptional regulator [Candidatus Riflebacteria bacterium]|nr:transcriptional regulator [Candidatus Riflebacteria bacterium]